MIEELRDFAAAEGFTEKKCRCGNPLSAKMCDKCGGLGVVFEMHGDEYNALFVECCREGRLRKEKENA
jgi:hypothetical protein